MKLTFSKDQGYPLIGESLTFASDIFSLNSENSAIIEKIDFENKIIEVKFAGSLFIKHFKEESILYGAASYFKAQAKII